ncbi:MAG: hypothetical protein JJE40_10025 [Vicinamibacteria bacterium]|nr:hypothetical protein [Vicinamibacteria bacterium]
MSLTRLFPLALALVAMSTPAAAQTADELIQKYIAARGGAARLAALTSVRFVRTYGTFGANLPVTIIKKRSGLYRSDQALPGRPTVARGLDATSAWESVNGKVTRRPADQELELRELDGDFDGFLVDYKVKGHGVEYLGREKAGGIDTHKLKVTLKSGAVRHVYLDATTFLERKQEGTVTLPDGKVPVIITFGDWRDVDGVKFPFAIDEERVWFPPQTFAIYTERIELNPPVDEAMFKMPGK